MVSKIVEDMLNKVRAEAVAEARLECIKNITEAFDVDVERAMDVLEIPLEDRDRYRKKLSCKGYRGCGKSAAS